MAEESTSATMIEPLLPEGSSAASEFFAWPNDVSARAKLFIPSMYKEARKGSANNDDDNHLHEKCMIVYDRDQKVLDVKSMDNQTLDVIDPDDIIGADIEIKCFGSLENLRATNILDTSFRNDTDNKNNDLGCSSNIFQSLADDDEGIFSSCNNEPLSDIPFDTQASAVLNLYVYPRMDPSKRTWGNKLGLTTFQPKPDPQYQKPSDRSKLGNRYAFHRKFDVCPAEDFSDISSLVRAIRTVCGKKGPESNKYLVLINPKSGPKGNGEAIYEQICKPMLDQAGIDHVSWVSKYARHATDRMNQRAENDISEFDGLITIGGDGLLHEVLQGIRVRSDCDALLKKLKIGIIGAGSANGMAKSLAYWSQEQCSPLDSTYLVCKGITAWMDISKYETTSCSYFSFLTYSWSMISNIDLESECIRFMGSTRFDLWAVWRVLFYRTYKARFSYLPAEKASNQKVEQMPHLNDPVPTNWESSEDNFPLFWASHVSHAAENTFHSPPSKVDDGIFQILIARGKISRFQMAMILLGLEDGSHIGNKGVEFVKCTAYRMEPITANAKNNLDGEAVEDGVIQAEIIPAAIRVFCQN